MHAVRNAAGDTAPDGESPFTIHSTVYAQLARGWPKYSGNRSAVFSPAANEGSSGTDRFVCSDAKQASEGSQSNVDAGEFRTAGYKSPAEVEAVMISPTPIHPGVGRRLAKDRSEAAFRAAVTCLCAHTLSYGSRDTALLRNVVDETARQLCAPLSSSALTAVDSRRSPLRTRGHA